MRTTIVEQTKDSRVLLSEADFAAIAVTVRDNNPGMDDETAERILAEALKYLAACGLPHDGSLRPSRVVDEGWHALILWTQVYGPLCSKLAGRFIHHVPERGNVAKHDPDALTRTTAAILAAGYTPDYTLWRAPGDSTIAVAADCEHTKCGDAACAPPCDSTPN